MFNTFETLQELLPDGWDAEDESILICPHGHTIELDGNCPEGCESPLITMGMI